MKKRRKRKIRFIVVLGLSILAFGSKAQKNEYGHQAISGHRPEWKNLLIGKPYPQGIVQPSAFLIRTGLNQSSTSSSFQLYPSRFYISQLAFFCKREWEFEKKVHIPLRLRIGSLADCNFLEGKGH